MGQRLITIDTDWAPDWIIDYVAEILIKYQVRATWFVTHESQSITSLLRYKDLFELGIHPNFMQGSSHGTNTDEVLGFMKELFPLAVSMRTHGLVQSTAILIAANTKYGIKNDVSLFLPYVQGIRPHVLKFQDCKIYRVPYYWGDDLDMFNKDPLWGKGLEDKNNDGIEIYNFHPIHIYLNTKDSSIYQKLKQEYPTSISWKKADLQKYINYDPGPQNTFLELIHSSGTGGELIKDIND
jgi:hypothetical protein